MSSASVRNIKVSTNYLRQFRDSNSLEIQKLSAIQFMNVWEHYDKDGQCQLENFDKTFQIYIFHSIQLYIHSPLFHVLGNGFIEGEELNAFLKEFIASINAEDNLQVKINYIKYLI